MNHRRIIFAVALMSCCVLCLSCGFGTYRPDPDITVSEAQENKALSPRQLRDHIAAFVRNVAENRDTVHCHPSLAEPGTWEVTISLHHDGREKGSGTAVGPVLYKALKPAASDAVSRSSLSSEQVKNSWFIIRLENSGETILEHNGTGYEMIKKLVAVRSIDREQISTHISKAKEYLFRVIDDTHKGAHKYYYAASDTFKNRLHTIYTSSLVFTLLKLKEIDDDPRLSDYIHDCGEFILWMQNTDTGSRANGGFHYSYFTDRAKKEDKYVVGTTSKTIFTLLKLYTLTGEKRYLTAARGGADWLLTMQRTNGSMKPYIRLRGGKWYHSTKESMLYNGQVLSALSRMYGATGDKKYVSAARKIAERFVEKYKSDGCYVGDDYRKPNPISSSWMILALFDYFLVTDDQYYGDLVFACADNLLARQIDNPDDLYRHGRWRRSLSTSGNGWLNEVMSELFLYCMDHDMPECKKYKEAIVKVSRWILQRTYTAETAWCVKNPQRADGGIFWNRHRRYVRTDSVCHGLNAWINISPYLDEGIILTLPENR